MPSPSSVRTFALAALLGVLMHAGGGHAMCDPDSDPDKTDVANARAAIAANCDCAGATSHGAYVSCAAQQANLTLVNTSCSRAVKRCAARSTCGKLGAVTCCVTRTSGTKCKVKRDAAHCKTPAGGTACIGSYTSCCDACGPAGCATTTTTTSTTTTTTLPCGGCDPGSVCGAFLTYPPVGLLAGNLPHACFPAGATPCLIGPDFPGCGGACPAGMACGAFQDHLPGDPTLGSFAFCACVDSAQQCTFDIGIGTCTSVGLCPPGSVCTLPFPFHSCGCVTPGM